MTKDVKTHGTFENMIMEGVTMPLIRDEIKQHERSTFAGVARVHSLLNLA